MCHAILKGKFIEKNKKPRKRHPDTVGQSDGRSRREQAGQWDGGMAVGLVHPSTIDGHTKPITTRRIDMKALLAVSLIGAVVFIASVLIELPIHPVGMLAGLVSSVFGALYIWSR
jgi:hypothetical protein